MNFSYWEQQTWLSNVDFTIVGSGITGLNCALSLRERFPNAKILILERGFLPHGASTRNAGFGCFGSLSEILNDLETHTEDEVLALIKRRSTGLHLLRKNLGDEQISYKGYGGYEVFTLEDRGLYDHCAAKMPYINQLLKPLFGNDVFSSKENIFGFKNVQEKLIFSRCEGQVDTGKMMSALLQKVQAAGVKILNGTTVEKFIDVGGKVKIKTDRFELNSGKLLIATNGFASKLGVNAVKPARAQVLITKPIPGLKVKGNFHFDRGYYYFRNVEDRVLFGGGRNLDFAVEETTEMAETGVVQNKLRELLSTTILPGIAFEVDLRWSGIMGVGNQKKPVIERLSANVMYGVRLAGMGVAIGSVVGKELADLIE